MEFKFDDSTLFENADNKTLESNSYMILSKGPEVKESDLSNVIQIIDESGNSVTCTIDKFVEIFDDKGLSGFIM